MIAWRRTVAVVAWVLLAGCSTTEWVHPNKPKDAFAQDYNACQTEVLRDPKLQQGIQLLLDGAEIFSSKGRRRTERSDERRMGHAEVPISHGRVLSVSAGPGTRTS